jgi:hypothetical protein
MGADATVNPAGRAALWMQAQQALRPLKRIGAHASLACIGITMTSTTSLIVAALLSTAAAVSFAQTPAAPTSAPAASAPKAAKAPADPASAPMHHKKHHTHHAAKKKVPTPVTPGASAAK